MEDYFPDVESESVQTVSQLTRQIKKTLEPNFRQIWVKGEISNLRFQQSGHCYFSLKDKDSQLPCVFFNRFASACNFELEDGVEVILFGEITLYEPYGRYQLSVKVAQEAGKGNLHVLYEQLKKKLNTEGLFDPEQKKSIPQIPQNIALITSPTGAAAQDFIRILKRRNFASNIHLLPVKVQGKQAKDEIVEAIEYISENQERYDLVVLTRGGGSIEDLWSFNEESVARALFNCPVPSISAIGHQIDTVLTDLVADYRAETPSGAAEFISSNYLSIKESFIKNQKRLSDTIQEILNAEKFTVQAINQKLILHTPQNYIDKMMIQMDVLEKELSQNLAESIKVRTAQFFALNAQLSKLHPKQLLKSYQFESKLRKQQIEQYSKNSLHTKRQNLEYNDHRLQNSSIQSSLKRGYVILKNNSNQILSNLKMAQDSGEIKACFIDGEIALKKKNEKKWKKFRS
jgi:exodeoxyribonuclease VII large subunit